MCVLREEAAAFLLFLCVADSNLAALCGCFCFLPAKAALCVSSSPKPTPRHFLRSGRSIPASTLMSGFND